ncbi:Uncharacterised protein [Mycobacterium tuberculosis]|nr:Uncharacterised protein [Mycobacterium tuberculosis]
MVGGVDLGLGTNLGAKAEAPLADALVNDLLQPGERSRDDEQHVGGVDLDELLMRVLTAPLRRNRRLSALQDFQQGLLNALTGDVASNRRVLTLAGDLVDLVDVDDAGLGAFDVVVGGLNKFEQDVLDVLADVTGLGQRGGVGDGKRHVKHRGQRLGQVGLATTGGSEHQDVRLGQLNGLTSGVTALLPGLDPLVVVVHRHGQRAFGGILPDDVALEELPDLGRLGQLVEFHIVGVGEFLFDDLVTQVDALIADVHAGAGNELLDLFLALPAERALQQVTTVSYARHNADGLLPDRRSCCRAPCMPRRYPLAPAPRDR